MANSSCREQYEERKFSESFGEGDSRESSPDNHGDGTYSYDWHVGDFYNEDSPGVEDQRSQAGEDVQNPRKSWPPDGRSFVEVYPGAGDVRYTGENSFEAVWKKDRYYEERQANSYYPFSCYMDFEVGKWLTDIGIPMLRIDQFFKLKYVRADFLYFMPTSDVQGEKRSRLGRSLMTVLRSLETR